MKKQNLLQRHHWWDRAPLEFEADFVHISWMTSWTERFVHCSSQDKFGKKSTRTAPWITFTSNHKTVDETSKIQITSQTRLVLPLLILSHDVYLSLKIYLIVKSYWTRLSMIWRIMQITECSTPSSTSTILLSIITSMTIENRAL